MQYPLYKFIRALFDGSYNSRFIGFFSFSFSLENFETYFMEILFYYFIHSMNLYLSYNINIFIVHCYLK